MVATQDFDQRTPRSILNKMMCCYGSMAEFRKLGGKPSPQQTIHPSSKNSKLHPHISRSVLFTASFMIILSDSLISRNSL